MKRVNDIKDFEGSLHATLVNDRVLWVSDQVAKFFWDSLDHLKHWAGDRNASLLKDGDGYLMKVGTTASTGTSAP